MKKILYLLVFLPFLSIGQTSTENYIKTTTYRDANTANPKVNVTYFDGLGRPIQQNANQQSNTGKDIVTHIEYDVLGRQAKDFLPYASSQSTMAIINSTTLRQNTITQYQTQYGDTNPYSETVYEISPLNRPLKQGAPGNAWAINPTGSDHSIKFVYGPNSLNEVKFFKATANWDINKGLFDITLSQNGSTYYKVANLYKTVTKDENWVSGKNNTTEEYKNKEGQLVMKRTYSDYSNPVQLEVAHSTYYVYDQYGNLTYVIPPKANGTITQAVLDGLCYQYKYDNRNRLVEKKLPGKQWEFIVYDRLDRVVATGPTFSPFTDYVSPNNIGWTITKYDIFNRPVYTGWMQDATPINNARRQVLQGSQNTVTALHESKLTSGTIDGIPAYYSNSVAPTSFKLLTVNYYDDYVFPNIPSPIPTTVMADNSQAVFYNETTKPKGLPTGNWTRVLTTSSSLTGENSYTLYDNKGRPVRAYHSTFKGGFTLIDSKIDFAGKTLFSETTHQKTSGSSPHLIREAFTYSSQDRLLTHTHSINGSTPELLSANTYDELGQLISKKVGQSTTSPIQKVDYSYNIRNWLTGINKTEDTVNNDPLTQPGDPTDLFAFKINYNTVVPCTNYTGKALYNGNISETYWRTSSDNTLRKYGYQYDNLNRLNAAVYIKPADDGTNDSFNENNIRYDLNGNIMHLERNGGYEDNLLLPIDVLDYVYPANSNVLSKVTDSTNDPNGFKDDSDGTNDTQDDYTYDANGNMTRDQNKGIIYSDIVYNHLNLPMSIIFSADGLNKITYIYNALGQKLEKDVVENGSTTSTFYLDGFQYINNTLKTFPHAEGYVNATSYALAPSGYNFRYVFNYTDHLGNVRLSYSKDPDNGQVNILQENHYYPFGLKHATYNAENMGFVEIGTMGITPPPSGYIEAPYKYKYNGKELQDELGLNMYDYGARNYDPALGRWMNIDPMAELAHDLTPNRYCFNNPVRFMDPTGLWETTNGGYTTNKPEDIKRFMSFLETENVALNNSPTIEQQTSFIDGEMSAGGHGKLSDGSLLADEISITPKGNINRESFSNFWHGVQRTQTPEALDTRTLGQNLLGLSYPGGNNPKTYSGNDDFSYMPSNLAEYPAIGHDRRYDNLGIKGASGLFTDTRAISTDYRFVVQSLQIALVTNNWKTKAQASLLGTGLGLFASFKAINHMANPFSGGLDYIMVWDSVANKGVNNAPSK